ncbi:MAG: trigger factor [Tissierellia bacterium]|nr:trigger factor [Tissierellia bacterium]
MIKLVSHENDKAVFTVEVSFDEFKNEVQKAYLNNRGRFNIPGFRKGKAPKQIIEVNYGKEVFWADALDQLLPGSYLKGVDELELKPIAKPEVDVDKIEEGKTITLTFTVETQPVPELADYSVIEIEKLNEEVSEEEIDARIKSEIEKNKVIKTAEDRAVKEGDIAVIDFEGFKDEVAFEGGKGENYELKIGSKTFIPGFEEGIVGAKKGDKLDLNVTFPEDYQAEELKGQPVVFKVEVKEIKEEILPELDDEFVMDVSEFDTVEEYRADIKAKLEDELKKSNEQKLENLTLEKVISMTEVTAPESMVEEQIDREFEEYKHNLSHMGLTIEMFYNATQSSEEDVRAEFRERAIQKVKAELVLDALVEKQGVEVTDEELEQEYKDISKQYGQENEKFLEQIKKSISPSFVKDVIKKRKVVKSLVKNVKFVEKKEETEE